MKEYEKLVVEIEVWGKGEGKAKVGGGGSKVAKE